MLDAEKVIKGLEWCMNEKHDCYREKGCPYENEGEDIGCKYALHRDALALLKAQEPRVMTLEEYKAWMDIPFQERDPIFHEMKLRRGSVTGWTNTADCCVENYGKTARCWTSRPTDEQREAVPWNG